MMADRAAGVGSGGTDAALRGSDGAGPPLHSVDAAPDAPTVQRQWLTKG